jgi:hypothetical protein
MNPIRVAAVLAVIGLVAAWQLTAIPESAIQMTVGARVVPTAVVGFLVLLTLLYGLSAWRGRQADESLEEGQEPLPGSSLRLVSLMGAGVAFMARLCASGHGLRHVCGARL